MNITQLNIDNLNKLWRTVSRASGVYKTLPEIEYGFTKESQWPNRIWTQGNSNLTTLDTIEKLLTNHKPQLAYSYFDVAEGFPIFKSSKINVISKQYGMSLDLTEKFEVNFRLEIKPVNTESNIKQWCKHFESAFNYSVHPSSVELTQNEIQYFGIWHNEIMVGTIILYITNEIAGIHSLGIIPPMRGKGYAKETMQLVLNKALDKGAKKAVLQASEMAKEMYLSMGFQQDFLMYNFRRTQDLNK